MLHHNLSSIVQVAELTTDLAKCKALGPSNTSHGFEFFTLTKVHHVQSVFLASCIHDSWIHKVFGNLMPLIHRYQLLQALSAMTQ